MKNQIIAMILAAAMILTVFTGCAAVGGNGTSVPTTVATTDPEGTTSAGKEQTTAPDPSPKTEKESVNTTSPEETTAPEATTAPDDETKEPATSTESTQAHKETESAATEPPATEPPTTEPPATEPPSTEPPVTTAPAHEHSYTVAETVAPGCASDGYTVYQCSCGSKYTDDEVSAVGHSWSDWSVTKEATSSAEGEKIRTCSACGTAETEAIEKLPAEPIDTAALEAYGRQYAANTYGYEPVVGTRAGYYPGWTVYIDSMEKGRSEVAECVDAMTDQLVASGVSIVVIVDGEECAAMMDIEVVHEGGNQYCVWVYYG